MQDLKKTTVLETPPPTMAVRTGLLIVSNPTHIGKILPSMKKYVDNTLYIQLITALTEPFGCFYPNLFNTWPKFRSTVRNIYAQAANHCDSLDVRVLLAGLKYKNLEYIQTKRPVDVVIFDRNHSENDVNNFIKKRIKSIASGYTIVTDDSGIIEEPSFDSITDSTVYKHSVLGGTFDRLHVAHKLLLTEAALRTSEKITVGVTEENMLENKTLWELVEPIDKRIYMVNDFLEDADSRLERNVVPIADLFGPAKDDPSIEMIIVSEETIRGGSKINEVRSSEGLKPLKMHTVELIDDPCPSLHEEQKISSSTIRMRILGTLLKPVTNKLLNQKPYIIGLTGGIASGKSGIAKRLGELGAYVIECDKIAHKLYEPGKPCYDSLVNAFGKSIVSETGEINRKVLGAIVFKDPKQLQKLNSLLWPAMFEDIQNQIKQVSPNVVVIEAAILLRAGWEKNCHEVWTTIIPPQEAVKRMQDRNKLTEDEAKNRLNSQFTNKQYVDASNVVLCSLWPVEYTRKQVDKSWELLQSRIPS